MNSSDSSTKQFSLLQFHIISMAFDIRLMNADSIKLHSSKNCFAELFKLLIQRDAWQHYEQFLQYDSPREHSTEKNYDRQSDRQTNHLWRQVGPAV